MPAASQSLQLFLGVRLSQYIQRVRWKAHFPGSLYDNEQLSPARCTRKLFRVFFHTREACNTSLQVMKSPSDRADTGSRNTTVRDA
eukprot:2653931-Pleurochrysis_carterae.AAC.2